MYRTLSAPILVQWEVTPVCNHNCIHCYNYWRVGPPVKALPKNYKALYTKIVDELIEANVFSVVVTGGEPLVVIRQVAPFIKRLSDAGIKVSLNTNLTLLTQKRADLLKWCGIRSILTSFPSAIPEHCDFITSKKNSLPSIVKGIKMAVANGFLVSANMVVSRVNQYDIEFTAGLVESLGVRNLAITRASNPIPGSWFAEHVLDKKEFLEMQSEIDILTKKFPFDFTSLEAISLCAYGENHVSKVSRSCGAGKNSCAIGVDGNIRACIRLEKPYGHINDGLAKAWFSMDEARSDEWIPVKCQPCKLKNRCGGGCKADALVATGSVKNPDPLCDFDSIPTIPPQVIPICTADNFLVSPKLKSRTESFGVIISVASTRWFPVHSDLNNILSPGGNINLGDISKALESNEEDSRKTASFLVDKGVLIPR